jgi:hypothetical protein
LPQRYSEVTNVLQIELRLGGDERAIEIIPDRRNLAFSDARRVLDEWESGPLPFTTAKAEQGSAKKATPKKSAKRKPAAAKKKR